MRSTERDSDDWLVPFEQVLEKQEMFQRSVWENNALRFNGHWRGELPMTWSTSAVIAGLVQAFPCFIFLHPTSTAVPSHRGARASEADEIAMLRDEQARLRNKLRVLEQKLDELLATRRGETVDTEEVATDPYTRWIEDNIEHLRQYPDEWIALHPEQGIVFHAADGEVFDTWFDSVPSAERTDLMILHTSMYI